MYYEEMRTKHDLIYINLLIKYNSKFILLATSLGPNAVVVTRVDCITIIKPLSKTDDSPSFESEKSFTMFGPHHAKACLLAYADSEGPNHPAHPRSLIKAITVR